MEKVIIESNIWKATHSLLTTDEWNFDKNCDITGST